MRPRSVGAALTAAALLAVPATAGAATKTVSAGPFGSANQKKFQDALADANAYFRKSVTIHKGDSVRWNINGFHSVTFVPKGSPAPPLAVPDTTKPVSGVNDSAGSPFWFNGQPRIVLNPGAAFPAGGKRFSASRLTSSGLPLDEGPPRPYKLKFNTVGTHKYICVVHPGMAGSVRVVRRGRRVPSARADRREAARQQKVLLQRAQRLTQGIGTEDLEKTIQAGNDRKSGEEIFKFFPANPTFKVGDTATLQISSRSTDIHTITFGPTNGKDAYNDQLAANFISPDTSTNPPAIVFDPRAIYPSENPAAGVPSYTGSTHHGNGFFNSGVLDADGSSPQPQSTKVTFTAPGTFKFICLVHPFMTGEATVTP
jgi:plastocyanin